MSRLYLPLLLVLTLCTCGRGTCSAQSVIPTSESGSRDRAQTTSSPADQDHIHSIFFGGGSYFITPGEQARLQEFLDNIPNLEAYEIEIQGHTDDIGNRAYNLRLSEYRARATQERLIAYPLAPEAMQMLPLGEDAPEFDNGTWEGKLSNRRVDVILKRIVM